jgi:hypothetical protein
MVPIERKEEKRGELYSNMHYNDTDKFEYKTCNLLFLWTVNCIRHYYSYYVMMKLE